MMRLPPESTRTAPLFPYTTLCRSSERLVCLDDAGLITADQPGDTAARVLRRAERTHQRDQVGAGFVPRFTKCRESRIDIDGPTALARRVTGQAPQPIAVAGVVGIGHLLGPDQGPHSAEHRVGKGCVHTRSTQWAPSTYKKKTNT